MTGQTTNTPQKNDEALGFFGSVIFGAVGLFFIIAAIIGIVTMVKTWEDTTLVFNHGPGTITAKTSTWWGYKSAQTTYEYTDDGWCSISTDGTRHKIRNTDYTETNIKDAATGVQNSPTVNQLPENENTSGK